MMTNQERDSFSYLHLIIGIAILALTSIYLKFNGLHDLGFFTKLIIIIIGSFILTKGSVGIVMDKSFSIRLLKIIGIISISIGILISIYYIIKSFEWVWIVNREEMIWSIIVFLFKFIFLCIKTFFLGAILIIAGFHLIKGAQIIPEPLSPDENTEKCGECNGTGVKINIIEKKFILQKQKKLSQNVLIALVNYHFMNLMLRVLSVIVYEIWRNTSRIEY